MAWLKNGSPLCLASASPRRLELLQQVGIKPFVSPAEIDETIKPGETPRHYVKRMATTKARSTMNQDHARVLAADTIVVLDGVVLGKPFDNQEAEQMLERLSGRPHQVMTAIALFQPQREKIDALVVETAVWFKKVSRAEIQAYVATGEPMDKAGSYGIQGFGAFMVERIDGSYTAVVGLPLFETLSLLTNSN
ncbi:MAG: septum formation inhibitor Maf [Magnetococcales bacterium]|nr:septum formation inhibitor Maf [Magnetococcales bacterium]